jgi:hypothetical protein
MPVFGSPLPRAQLVEIELQHQNNRTFYRFGSKLLDFLKHQASTYQNVAVPAG